MVEVNPHVNSSLPEKQESRAATPNPPAESSATERTTHPSAPQGDPWSPESIQLLLDVWASPKIQAMREAGKRLRVIYRAIASRLYKEGVQRSWVQCREMMLDLEDLYFTIQEANQKRQGEPLPCPFYEGLIRVLPFTHTWQEGPGHEVPDAEPTDYDPSGACSWNPLPFWTPPWLPHEITFSEASTDQGETRETDNKSPQEPPREIPWTPSTLICIPNHMINGHCPQSTPQETPWTSRSFISLSDHVTQEQTFHYPEELIPLQPIPFSYIQHQGPTENNPQFQTQDIPLSLLASGTMEHEEADQRISQDKPQGIPLITMDHEEPVTNSSQDSTPLIAQPVPTLHSVQNEETDDTTTQSNTPQEISYSPQSSTQNQVNYEYYLSNPGLMRPSPLPYPHGPPHFFPPPLFISPFYIHT